MDWLGPIPDEEDFQQISMPPAPDQVALHETLEDIDAIKFDAKEELSNLFKDVTVTKDPYEEYSNKNNPEIK